MISKNRSSGSLSGWLVSYQFPVKEPRFIHNRTNRKQKRMLGSELDKLQLLLRVLRHAREIKMCCRFSVIHNQAPCSHMVAAMEGLGAGLSFCTDASLNSDTNCTLQPSSGSPPLCAEKCLLGFLTCTQIVFFLNYCSVLYTHHVPTTHFPIIVSETQYKYCVGIMIPTRH